MNFDGLTEMRHIPPVYDDSGRRHPSIELVKNSMLHSSWGSSSSGHAIKYVCLRCTVSTARMNVIHSCSEPSGNPIIATHKNNPILRFLKFCNGHPLPTPHPIKSMSGYLLCLHLLVIIFIKRHDRISVW